jgi:cytochrome bd-type quinol oxidase subunit 2
LALDINGWIDGITATGVVVFGIIFGLFFIYRAKKTNAKLLVYLGLANMLAGLMFLGVFLDFLFVLVIQENMANNGTVAILSYIWFAPVIIISMYIGAELLIPKIKRHILIIVLIISIVFEIIIFIQPLESFNFVPEPPEAPSINLIDYNVNLFTLAGMIMGGLLLLVLIFLGFGFLYKAFESSGIIRKNFFYLSAGSICFCIFGLLEGLTVPGFLVILVRIGYLSSFWLMYSGL